MDTKQTKVTLDATARRGFGRDASWTVSVLGVASGYGPTMGEARESAAEVVADLIRNMTTAPAFAVDDDGTLIVAVAQGSGTAVWRWKLGQAPRFNAWAEGSPSEYVERIPHYSVAS